MGKAIRSDDRNAGNAKELKGANGHEQKI